MIREATLTGLVILGSLVIVALWEFAQSRRRREFPALRRRSANIAFWLVNLLLAAFFFGPAMTARPRIEALFGIGLPPWPIAGMASTWLAGFLFLDFLYYLVHRCEHAVPFLWRFHALHHSDPDVDVTTAVRHHPIEYLLASGVFWIAAILFDIPAYVLLTHGLAVFGMAAVQHGNVRLTDPLERWLQPVLVTIDLHRVHHSVSVEHANSNYGAVLSLWDRLFGTLTRISRAQHQTIVFGVRELPRGDCLKPSAMLLTPWLLARARRAATGG
jgi:sterol desaturase/sphingolipid hydroxylase (fatty acid hydroxylase superfamily)